MRASKKQKFSEVMMWMILLMLIADDKGEMMHKSSGWTSCFLHSSLLHIASSYDYCTFDLKCNLHTIFGPPRNGAMFHVRHW
jgi:hypothetical protein